LGKKLQAPTRFNIPFDEQTDDGRQLVVRLELGVGTDRRRVKRCLRVVLQRLGIKDYTRAIRELGFNRHV
jgi:hypothetical protein